MQVVGDEPNHHREPRMSATDGNGVEGAEPHARSQCGTLRGLAHGIQQTMSQLRPQGLGHSSTRPVPHAADRVDRRSSSAMRGGDPSRLGDGWR